MLSLAKWVLSMYIPLVAKMAKDNAFMMAIRVNFGLLCDMDLFIPLFCLMFMLVIVHALVKFA